MSRFSPTLLAPHDMIAAVVCGCMTSLIGSILEHLTTGTLDAIPVVAGLAAGFGYIILRRY